MAQFRALEKNLTNYAQKSELERVSSQMKGYTSLEKFNEKNIDVQKNFNDIEQQMRKFATRVSMESHMEKQKNEIMDKCKAFSLKKDCQNVQQGFVQRFEKQQAIIDRAKKDLWECNKNLGALTSSNSGKVEQKDLERVNELIATLPTRDETQRLTDKLNRSLEYFTTEHERFNQGFESQNEIIRDYDVVISTKSSKHALYVERTALKEAHDKLNQAYEDTKADLNQQTNDMRERMEEIDRSVEQNTLAVINHWTERRDKMNAAIDNDPKSVELGNPRAMYKALSVKADRFELEKINEMKTNRSELNTFVDRLSIM